MLDKASKARVRVLRAKGSRGAAQPDRSTMRGPRASTVFSATRANPLMDPQDVLVQAGPLRRMLRASVPLLNLHVLRCHVELGHGVRRQAPLPVAVEHFAPQVRTTWGVR